MKMRFVLLQKKTSERAECVKVKLIAQYFRKSFKVFLFFKFCVERFSWNYMVAVCVCVLEIRFGLNMKHRELQVASSRSQAERVRLFDDDDVDDDYAKKKFNIQKMSSF